MPPEFSAFQDFIAEIKGSCIVKVRSLIG